MIAGTLEIQLLADIARLRKDMDDAKSVVGGAMASIERSVAQAKMALATLGAIGLAVALAGEVKAVIDYADALNKLSQRAGMTAEQLSEWHYAAKLADVSQESFNTGVKKLNISIAEGLAGDKEKIAMFKALGITTRDLGQGTEAVMLKIADAYAKGADGPGKVTSAVKLLGKAGDEMIPLLNGGSDAVMQLREEARKLGLTISTDFGKQAEEFNDNLTRLRISGQRLTVTMGADLVKGLGDTMKAMAEASIEGGKLRGIIAGIQTLLTGTDRYKNDKAMVEQTDRYMATLKSYEEAVGMDAAQKRTTPSGRTLTFKGEMDRAKAELDLTLKYRKVLEDADARAAAAGKDDGKDKPTIRIPGADAAQSEYDKIVEKIKQKLAAEKAEAAVGRELTEAEKYRLQVMGDVEKARRKLTPSQREGIDLALKETTAYMERNAARANDTKRMLAEEEEFQRTQAEIRAAEKANADARTAGEQAVRDYVQGITDSNSLLELEIKLLGASEKQRTVILEQHRVELDLKKQIQSINSNSGFDQAQREAERAKAEAAAAAAKAGASARAEMEEQKRILNSIDSTAHDVWTNIFEGGQSVFKKLGSVLKSSLLDMLYQLTVRPFVIQLAAQFLGVGGSLGSGLAGAAGSALGSGLLGGITNSAGGSMFGGIFNPILNGATNFGSSIMGALGLGGTAAAGGLGLTAALGTGTTLAATGTGLGLSAGLGSGLGLASAGGGLGLTTASAGASAIGAGLGGAGVAGAGGAAAGLAAIPGWGWAALGVGALLGLGGGGDTRNGGAYSWSPGSGAAFTSGPGGLAKQINGDQAMASVGAAADSINGLLSALGSKQQLSAFYGALESSKKGRGGVMSGGRLSSGAAFGEDLLGSNYTGDYFESTSTQSPDDRTAMANFITDLKQVTIQALQAATDIPRSIADKLRGIDAESLSDEAATALVNDIKLVIDGVQGLREAAKQLPFANLKNLSFDAAAGLVELVGGLDALNSSLTSYYQDYYTEAERTALATRQVRDALAALGYALPASRDGFRELVDLQDLNSEAGRKTYAELLKLAPAFSAITTSAEQSAEAARQAAEEWRGLADELLSEARQIRGESGGTQQFAAMQSDFAIATAQARAGDKAAIALLPTLSRDLVSQAAANSRTAADYAVLRGTVAGSLETTAALLGGGSLSLNRNPAISSLTPPPAPAPTATSTSSLEILISGMRAEVSGLRAEVAALRADNSAENRALVNYAAQNLRIAQDWDTNGLPEERTA